MKSLILTITISFLTLFSFSQSIDTITFHSEAFNEERTIYVHTPLFYKYQAEDVKLPVIYLLDGQHEWFVDPILSDINFLQYTHEMPAALVVVIPHLNRVKECAVRDIKGEIPLHKLITEEIDNELEKYYPSGFRILIGHSFSASFALYSYLKNPEFYSAVIAHTPLDNMSSLVETFDEDKTIERSKISISIGGIDQSKDAGHRKEYNRLKTEFPSFFSSIQTFEADQSTHNAVPIVSTPFLLTNIFAEFIGRFSHIAVVDDEYKLIELPEAFSIEMNKIKMASKIGNFDYPPEIPELNGIASRYSNSGYNDLALEVYKLGVKYYPKLYEFYLYLYELQIEKDKEQAVFNLNKAEELLNTIEEESKERDEILLMIKGLKSEK